jgi:hypothetical protein
MILEMNSIVKMCEETIKYNIIGGACMIFSRFRLQVGRSIESWHVDERNESMLINRKEERKTNHRNKKKA